LTDAMRAAGSTSSTKILTRGLLPLEAFGLDGPMLVVGQETS
jgi:hypothetical protein